MAFNYTNLTNSNNWMEMTTAANRLSGGALGVFLPIAIFAIAYIGFATRYPAKQALAGASFVSLPFTLFMSVLGVIPLKAAIWNIVVLCLAGIALWVSKES